MSTLGITAFDIGVAAVVILSALLALARGFVREAMSLASWVAAAAAAWLIYPELRPFVDQLAGPGLLSQLLTGLVAFLVPLIAFRVLTGMLANALVGLGFGGVDRALGLVFGLARGALIVCVAYLVGSAMVGPHELPATVSDAALHPPVRQGAAWLAARLPADLVRSGRQGVQSALTTARERRDGEGGGPATPPGGGYGRESTDGMNRLLETVR